MRSRCWAQGGDGEEEEEGGEAASDCDSTLPAAQAGAGSGSGRLSSVAGSSSSLSPWRPVRADQVISRVCWGCKPQL